MIWGICERRPVDADAAQAAQNAANSAREAGYLVVTVGVGTDINATLLTDLASAAAFQMLAPPQGLDGVALSASRCLTPTRLSDSDADSSPEPGRHRPRCAHCHHLRLCLIVGLLIS